PGRRRGWGGGGLVRRPRGHGARARLPRGQGAPRRRRALHRPHQDIHHRGESDRRMKITAVTPFLVDPGYGKNWLFVKVETADGLHGWGECYTQADRDQAILAHVRQLGRY